MMLDSRKWEECQAEAIELWLAYEQLRSGTHPPQSAVPAGGCHQKQDAAGNHSIGPDGAGWPSLAPRS